MLDRWKDDSPMFALQVYLRITLRNRSFMLCQDLPGTTPRFSMILQIEFPDDLNYSAQNDEAIGITCIPVLEILQTTLFF